MWIRACVKDRLFSVPVGIRGAFGRTSFTVDPGSTSSTWKAPRSHPSLPREHGTSIPDVHKRGTVRRICLAFRSKSAEQGRMSDQTRVLCLHHTEFATFSQQSLLNSIFLILDLIKWPLILLSRCCRDCDSPHAEVIGPASVNSGRLAPTPNVDLISPNMSN